jgi:hypothetical protein
MTGPENTRQRDPLLHLLGSMSEGADGYITGMEAQGQRQLVASEVLPADTNGTDEEFTALGFTFGEPDSTDPLFRPATLPAGWRKERTDHSMWSVIKDERGIERVEVFYKAAFYDRSAFMRVCRVGYSVADRAIYGDGPVSLDLDLLTGAEVADVAAGAREYLRQVQVDPEVYGKREGRAREVLRLAEVSR